MRTGWKFVLVLLVATLLCQQCANSKKTKQKLLKKLWNSKPKAAHQKTLAAQKKNAVQPSNEQMAAMQNPESLQPGEAEELNHLQNYNKQYINNEMAAETALLADQGIDDDSALKISNMAALPNGMPPGASNAVPGNGMSLGSHAAIKAKISNSAHAQKGTSAGPSQGGPAGYDPNAYLYDANSWPEYTIHDSDYSNFRSVEMNNMNGENTDMPNYDKMMTRRPSAHGYQNMGNEDEPEFQESKFQNLKQAESEFSDEMKQENGDAPQKKPSSAGNQAVKAHSESSAPVADATKLDAGSENKDVKTADSNTKPAPGPAQQSPSPQAPAAVKAEDNTQTAKDAPSQKLQQKPTEQQQPQAKATPGKLAESVAQAAASLPPKAIASLMNSIVSGGGKVAGTTAGQLQGQGQGQIQKNIAGSVSQSLIPQDINPAEEQTQTATQLHKVEKPKKH